MCIAHALVDNLDHSYNSPAAKVNIKTWIVIVLRHFKLHSSLFSQIEWKVKVLHDDRRLDPDARYIESHAENRLVCQLYANGNDASCVRDPVSGIAIDSVLDDFLAVTHCYFRWEGSLCGNLFVNGSLLICENK